MECSLDRNRMDCPCTYPCEKRGKCCECLAFHRTSGELPACYFTKEAERTYDRSIQHYLMTSR